MSYETLLYTISGSTEDDSVFQRSLSLGAGVGSRCALFWKHHSSVNAAEGHISSWLLHPSGDSCWSLQSVRTPRLLLVCWCNITWPPPQLYWDRGCPGLLAPCLLLLSSLWAHLQHWKIQDRRGGSLLSLALWHLSWSLRSQEVTACG